MIFLRNLLRAPARSLLTVIGLGAGLGLFIAIAAIATDLNQQINSMTSAYALEVIVYERRTTSPLSSRIDEKQMARLQASFGAMLTPMVIGTLKEKWSAYALLIGAPDDFARRTPLTAGAYPNDGSGDALLGELAAAKLGLKPGDRLTLDGNAVRISGIFRSGSRMLDGGVMTGIRQAQQMLTREGAEPVYTMALLRSKDRAAAAGLIREIEQQFPAMKAIQGTEFSGSLRLMRVVEAFVTTISVIALIGACLVLGNTLLMALSERTREIGVLMAIGWSPWLVLRMLLAESLALCVAGATLGTLFALLLLRVLNGIESIGFGWIPIRFPPLLALHALLMALAIGVVALTWPAVVVLRMQPLTALRHE